MTSSLTRSVRLQVSILLLAMALVLVVDDATAQTVDASMLSTAYTNAAESCKRSVVSINVGASKATRKRLKHFGEFAKRLGEDLDLDQLPSGSVGSGVIVSEDGYILTNHHVIDDIDEDSIVVTLHDGRRYYASVIGSDPSSDLAVLRIYARNLDAARIAQPTSVRLGELVIAIGSPLGLKFTVTSGVISAVNRDDLLDDEYSVKRYIQTDAAINPGNSGGGLFRLQGDLVGINTAMMSRSGYNIGYGLAMTTDLVSAVYADLRDDGRVSRPSLGVSARSESFDSSLFVDRSKVDETVIVDRVKPGGAAERAGLRVGDIIRSFNGMQVRSKDNIMQYMALYKPGQRIAVGLGRNGDTLQVDVDLDSMEVPFTQRDRASKRRPYIGVGLRVENGVGLLADVRRHGPFYHAGFQDADVLISVGGNAVQTDTDLTRILGELQPGAVLPVVCERRGVRIARDVVVGAMQAK